MKPQHRHTRRFDPQSRLAAEMRVEEVYYAVDPLWYLRFTSRFRLNWRRELVTLATVFASGIALGFLVGRS